MGSPHTLHEWRERTEDGELRYLRAWRGLGRWNFAVTRKSDPDWTPVPDPDRALLEALREKLHAKYLRRRVPWEQIAEIDKLLETAAPGNPATAPE
jgi:hypothetical protein